jgi:hypothetical protein
MLDRVEQGYQDEQANAATDAVRNSGCFACSSHGGSSAKRGWLASPYSGKVAHVIANSQYFFDLSHGIAPHSNRAVYDYCGNPMKKACLRPRHFAPQAWTPRPTADTF